MSLIEVKNNLLKFCYEEDLILSGFVRVTDSKNSYIAQVLHLEASRIGKVAVAKILFMYNNNEISSYNGSIPSLRAEVTSIDSSILLNTLEKTAPLNLGILAQQNQKLFVDMSVLKDNPIICAEKFFATKVFLNNLAVQLQLNSKKVIVFDTIGVFNSNKLTLGKDFKLPLNTSAINYIYEHGFEDATAETKALIQSIFAELSEYSKTVEFIPFNSFKSVVDSEFNRTKLIQLIFLKNKIKQIGDLSIYAETSDDIIRLNSAIASENTIVIDVSSVSESLQKECIKYVYSLLGKSNEEFYAFVPLNNNNSDKEILVDIHGLQNIHTTVICGYDYKYLDMLKQTSKNMFMFTPLKQQSDFGGYNIFLQKLAEDEYIAYGKMSKFVPLIVKLHPIKSDEVVVQQQPQVQSVVESVEPVIKEQSEQLIVEEIIENIEPNETDLSEEVIEEVADEVEQVVQLPVEEVSAETAEVPVEEPVEAESVQVAEQEPVNKEEQALEEISVQEEPPIQEPESQTATEEELTQALNEVPDIEDDEELSDDDLDMIEEMSNSDDEIEAIAEPSQPIEQVNVEESIPQAPVAEEPVVQTPVTEEEPVQQMPPVEEPIVPHQVNSVPPAQPGEAETLQNSSHPTVPVYSADIPEEDRVESAVFQQGDKVFHEEFGEGVVEKMINYGDKELCSINFTNVGRRLLNPEITELKKL